MEIWGEGSTWEELEASISACPDSIKDRWLGADVKFKIAVETYGFKIGERELQESIQRLHFIPFKVLWMGHK